MNTLKLTSKIVIFLLVIFFNRLAKAADDALIDSMMKSYREATIFIKSTKETTSGEIVYSYGTGFVISPKGHVLTSCHVVDQIIRDEDGNNTGKMVKLVKVEGAAASRYRILEPMGFITCGLNSIDIALVKFSDSSKTRIFVPIRGSDPPSAGDTFASLGYPLDVELFPRVGKVGLETPTDTYNVDITLNPGDSGGPVFNKKLEVVGVAEGGYTGAHIGVVRPIRHAGALLSLADVQISAVGANISSTPDPSGPLGSKVEIANPREAIAAFVKASDTTAINADTVKVTYPFAKNFEAGGSEKLDSPNFIIGDVSAKPGYKIVNSKFIVLEQQGAKVINVSPQSGGAVARTSLEKNDSSPGSTSFVRGFVETTQVRDKSVQNLR